MKRFIAIAISFAIIFSIIPFSVFATKDDTIQESIFAKACSVFPEYADRIRRPVSTDYSRNNQPATLIVTKTRHIAENECLLYTEYSDGIVLLANYTWQIIPSNTVSNPAGTTYTVSIKATTNAASGYYMVNNFKYLIANGQYDAILDDGTPYWTGSFTGPSSTAGTSIWNETASQAAKVEYRPRYTISAGTIETSLTMTVRNNVLNVSFLERG